VRFEPGESVREANGPPRVRALMSVEPGRLKVTEKLFGMVTLNVELDGTTPPVQLLARFQVPLAGPV
jgi:hypothetical protein